MTHIRNAIEIIRGSQLAPQLIYDKSRLNTQRILVLWLSPNDWSGAGGFRYGNVSFDFNWASIIESKRFYWVGAMPYTPSACRILITLTAETPNCVPMTHRIEADLGGGIKAPTDTTGMETIA